MRTMKIFSGLVLVSALAGKLDDRLFSEPPFFTDHISKLYWKFNKDDIAKFNRLETAISVFYDTSE